MTRPSRNSACVTRPPCEASRAAAHTMARELCAAGGRTKHSVLAASRRLADLILALPTILHPVPVSRRLGHPLTPMSGPLAANAMCASGGAPVPLPLFSSAL